MPGSFLALVHVTGFLNMSKTSLSTWSFPSNFSPLGCVLYLRRQQRHHRPVPSMFRTKQSWQKIYTDHQCMEYDLLASFCVHDRSETGLCRSQTFRLIYRRHVVVSCVGRRNLFYFVASGFVSNLAHLNFASTGGIRSAASRQHEHTSQAIALPGSRVSGAVNSGFPFMDGSPPR
jgi:hypothetical protein